jgi:hypothetical protein
LLVSRTTPTRDTLIRQSVGLGGRDFDIHLNSAFECERRRKALLTRIGRVTSTRLLHDLNSSLNYLAVGQWFARQNYRVERPTSDRFELFDQVAPAFSEKRVAYLEFGVWEGYTLRFLGKAPRRIRSRSCTGSTVLKDCPEPWTRGKTGEHVHDAGRSSQGGRSSGPLSQRLV